MKVVKILVWFLLLVLLTFNVYSFVSIRVLGNELAVIGGKAMVEVISGSMEPTIKVGDMIIIDTEASGFKEEDIITFRDSVGSFVTHRIIEVKEDGYVTKGDNNDSLDNDLVIDENIVGRYCFKITGLGVIIGAIKNPITFVIILLIGVILCFMASTDKEGKPVDVDDDYLEFLDYKNKKKKNLSNDNKDISTDTKEDTDKGIGKNTSKKESTSNNSTKNNKKSTINKDVNNSKSSKNEVVEEKKNTTKSSNNVNKKTNNGSTAKEKRADNISTTKKKNSGSSSSKSRTNTKK